MTRTIHKPQWIAGPVAYNDAYDFTPNGHVPRQFSFEFIGCSASGQIIRWRMRYIVRTRAYVVDRIPLSKSERDADTAARLLDLFRPIAVLRSMLPKGPMEVALKSMLTEEQKARLLAVSITHRDLFSE